MSDPHVLYSVFGLRVWSEIPLPELPRGEGAGKAEVRICTGTIDAGIRVPGVHRVGADALLVVEDVGRYLVRAGCEILVEAAAEVPQQNLRLFLLGSAFGLLLHQRGLLPLHANAVEFDGKAVAFTGESGVGKSTLAAWFHDRGYRIVADDVCVLRLNDGGGVVASPGIPRLRLWREVLEASGRAPEDYARSYAGDDSFDKFDVPIEGRSEAPVPLAAICLLEWGEEMRTETLKGAAAAEVVIANTYRGWVLEEPEAVHRHWQTAVRIAQQVPVYRFTRPHGTPEGSGSLLTGFLDDL